MEHPALLHAPYILEQYEELDPTIQRYFSRYEQKATAWRDAYNVYKVSRFNSKFPTYELKIKVTRAYSTHKGIPNGEAQAEYKRLHDMLYDAKFFCSKNGYSPWSDWHKYERTRGNRIKRKSWTQELNVLTKSLDSTDNYELVEDREFRAVSRAQISNW